MKRNRALSTAAALLAAAALGLPTLGREPGDRQMQEAQPRSAQAPTSDPTDGGSLFAATYTPAAPKPAEAPEHPQSASEFGSLYAVPSPQTRKFKKHDLLTVIVSETSDSSTTATSDAEKKQNYDLALQQFLQLNLANSGIPYITKVGNPSNLPEVQFNYDNKRQNNADQTRKDSFSARITAEVIDIKPNGTLVVQAVKTIRQDKEIQEFRLSGVCRSEDVTIDNTILSTQLADLKLEKETSGEVRDGTKRGWLNKVIDTFNPF